MSNSRRKFTAEFKTRVALDALSGKQTLSELASKYGVHPNQISQWKQQAKEQIADGFAGKDAIMNFFATKSSIVDSALEYVKRCRQREFRFSCGRFFHQHWRLSAKQEGK